jgi:hypothetical protein
LASFNSFVKWGGLICSSVVRAAFLLPGCLAFFLKKVFKKLFSMAKNGYFLLFLPYLIIALSAEGAFCH